MKTTRKIIPALVMLLVSAIMLSTASYAWFATQTTVEANTMSVKAKAEAKYLWISNNGTEWDTAVEAGTPSAEVSLVTATVDKASKKVTWFTGEGASPSSSEKKDELDELTGGIDAQHALINTFYFKADEGSIALNNLTIKSISVTGNDADYLKSALRVMAVVNGSAVQLWKPTVQNYAAGTNPGTYSGWEKDSTVSDEYLILTLEPGASHSVLIYAYYDGEDPTAFTNNAKALMEANITITFDVAN